ncbi:MAG: hypothetical protein R3Y11_02540 [Pseudomonadota bacterium]
MTNEISEDLLKIFERIPDYPTRQDIADATGLIAAQTLANRDAGDEGSGIPGGTIVGRVIRYPKKEVVTWLIDYCNKKKNE